MNAKRGRQKLDPARFGPRGEAFLKFAAKEYIGQPRIIEKLARYIDRAYDPEWNPEKPRGSFLILGGKGTGKTFAVKLLARFLFDDARGYFCINGQDYSQPHQVAKLLHSPSGYVLSDKAPILTQKKLDLPAVQFRDKKAIARFTNEEWDAFTNLGDRKKELAYSIKELKKHVEGLERSGIDEAKIKAHRLKLLELEKSEQKTIDSRENLLKSHYDEEPLLSIILIDEIDRGHEDLRELLFTVFDEGMFENSLGHEINFRNSFLFATSNLGYKEVMRLAKVYRGETILMGFAPPQSHLIITLEEEAKRDLVMFRECRKSAEEKLGSIFLDRIDEVVYARLHGRGELELIFDREMNTLEEKFGPHGDCPLFIHIDKDVRNFVVEEAFDRPGDGARPLLKKFKHYIAGPLIDLRWSKQIQEGDIVYITMGEENGEKRPVYSIQTEDKKLHLPPPHEAEDNST